jgi:hypothetical protein
MEIYGDGSRLRLIEILKGLRVESIHHSGVKESSGKFLRVLERLEGRFCPRDLKTVSCSPNLSSIVLKRKLLESDVSRVDSLKERLFIGLNNLSKTR